MRIQHLLVLGIIGATVGVAQPTEPAASGLDLARRLENAFVNVAEQASRSVVVISVTMKSGSPVVIPGNSDRPPMPDDFYHQRTPVPIPHDVEGKGSGMIYRPDGFILTNGHVVDHADKIKVRLRDGREFEAKRIGVDARTDVAIIKIETNHLPVATLADSDKVRVGQWAIAIGAPYELDFSFTVGYISATGRSVGAARTAYEDYLQTDAAINPGNSGGPLCDIEGRVVGMNTLIRGLNKGIGFAIPINMIRGVADQLIDHGRVRRSWLGVRIQALAEDEALAELSKPLKDGVVVRAVMPGTPAAASNLKPADIIVSVDGVAVKTPKDLQLQILHKTVGQQVKLDVYRDGKPMQVGVKTAEMDDEPRIAANPLPAAPRKESKTETALGLTVQTMAKEMAKQLDLSGGKGGVIVTEVAEGSMADDMELQPADIITEVNHQPVVSAEQFKAVVAKANAKRGILLYVLRGGEFRFVVVKEK